MITYTDPETGNVCACSLMSSVPEGVTGYEVGAPESKEFRDAWEITAGQITFNTVKVDKKKVITEAMRLINIVFPAIKDLDDIKFQTEFWKSLAGAAKTPTAEFQKVIDVYTVAKQAIANETPYDSVVWP